jgi:hypothetical protein
VALSRSTTNTVTISGTPDTAAQGVTFTVQVTDSASHSDSQSYTVSILLEPDTVTLTSASLTFAPQLVGTLSGAQTETITNSGTTPVVISGIFLNGTDAGDFGQSNNCGMTLAAGANCVINTLFAPTHSGPSSASTTITDNTLGSPHTFSFSGVGLTSGPNATLSAASLGFATQHVGTTSPAESITLTNYGTTALNITTIAATANFGETDNCQGSSLASGANCTINVTFAPSASGNLAGTLSITDNAPGSPQTVSLSGAGTTTNYMLTGDCYEPSPTGHMCVGTPDPTQCPAGKPAVTTGISNCSPFGPVRVDTSTRCGASRLPGSCVVQ